MIHFRCGTLFDLVRSAPSLPLWKCLGYFVLVAFGIELLVGVFNVLLMYSLRHISASVHSYSITYKPLVYLYIQYILQIVHNAYSLCAV